ncbi:MAG: PSD1 and planctomycete cytochrome C domain-containing protein [Pirellulales bacterium]
MRPLLLWQHTCLASQYARLAGWVCFTERAILFGLVVNCLLPLHGILASEPTRELLTFEQHIRPLFKAYCFVCHGEAGVQEGSLDVRLKRLLVQGGDSGAAIDSGNRSHSYLFERIESGEMPPGEVKMKPAEVELIGRWIDAGAPTLRTEPDTLGDSYFFTEEERNFWAFQPVQVVEVPSVTPGDRSRSPIDAFLLAHMEPAGLSFAPDADKTTLLRRACFDLVGLPPTPEQVSTFCADTSEGAYSRLLDRLLASPHYGERWGRHWLDTAGYAESEGYSPADPPRPHAYKYRDYVIRSLNDDKPMDQFIQEQLAGDEMLAPHDTAQNTPLGKELSPQQIERLTATGFLRMAADGTATGGVDQGLARNQVMADTLQIVTSTLLGITVGCAQCHDHRYDPIPQVDYYRLRAIFEPAYDWKKWRTPKQRLISLSTDADRSESARIEKEAVALEKKRKAKQQIYITQTLEKELAKIDSQVGKEARIALDTPAAKRTKEQLELLRKYPALNVTAGSLYLYDRKAADELKKMVDEIKQIRDTKPIEEFIRCLAEVPGSVPKTHLFARGDHEQPDEVVEPAALTILANGNAPTIVDNNPKLATTGRRLSYARYLTNGRHPLTARVMVNRIWMHHFGRGLVATPGDFGTLGARPTHPKLLDWLANHLVEGGWRLKRLHKLIMMSTAYRQSSAQNPEVDPVIEESYYARWKVRRLEAEVIRDAIIRLSGKLNLQMFGPAVPIREDEVGQIVVGIDTTDSADRPTGKVIPMHGQEYRRSVYITVKRSQPLAVLDTFDAPIMEPNCKRRSVSTVTPQALLLLNSPLVHSLADLFAYRVVQETDSRASPDQANPDQFSAPQANNSQANNSRAMVRAQFAWQLAYSRLPTENQLQEAVTFLDQLTLYYQEAEAQGTKNVQDKDSNQFDPARRALTSFCQALLSSNRFLYVD